LLATPPIGKLLHGLHKQKIMSIAKKIRIIAGSIAGTAFLLFVVLIIHIAFMVKGRKPPANATVQMVRVDFKQEMDSSAIACVESDIKSMKGVKDVYYNPQSHILIYSFDAKQNNAKTIYDIAINGSGYSAHRFAFAKNDQANGCPVMDNHSFYGRLTSIVETILN
jgi:hypothetical protein